MTAVGGRALQGLAPGVLRVLHSHLDAWATAGRVNLFVAAKTMGLDLSVDVIVDVNFDHIDKKWFKEQVRGVWPGVGARGRGAGPRVGNCMTWMGASGCPAGAARTRARASSAPGRRW